MSLSNAAETALLQLLFNNTTWANVGDATGIVGSGTAGSFYVSLHTADPGEAGDQSTSETAFTNYARVAVARTSGGWTVSGNTVSNTAAITFPQCGATGATITHWAVGRASSGAGQILIKGAVVNSPTNTLEVSNGVAPYFGAGTLTSTWD
jgi:hypothetical protein